MQQPDRLSLPPLRRAATLAIPLASAVLLAACSSPQGLVQGPMVVMPPQPATYLERTSNGAIYQASMNPGSLFSSDRKPRNIGDMVKVDIAETLKASQSNNTTTSRENEVAVKGPGGNGGDTSGFFNNILNADKSASGSDGYKGKGTTDTATSFTATVAASVINVLPNGYLVVAGERSMAFNGDTRTLRFSGVVDPRDIKNGNVVASADVVNAKLEVVGKGDVSEASSRTWLQRVLTQSLQIW